MAAETAAVALEHVDVRLTEKLAVCSEAQIDWKGSVGVGKGFAAAKKVVDAVMVVAFVAAIVGLVAPLLSVAMTMTNVAVALSDSWVVARTSSRLT